ncbi:uncharacterized protein LOC131632257 [Vicia villosa]|uniref:uncharacterized protein LOC131632257 n=1 Tax=Vicia villosa TaxID=3911 RepID=UPI00273A7835|nr:uncharacterized protein LOC131632257 [Vicia villosa]
MVRYLPERCMRQLERVQMIPRSLFEAAIDTITRRAFTNTFQNWEHHLVPEEYREMRAFQSWHYVDGYVTWFFKVSHPIMTPDAPWRPPRPAYEKLMENQQGEDDHAIDMLADTVDWAGGIGYRDHAIRRCRGGCHNGEDCQGGVQCDRL